MSNPPAMIVEQADRDAAEDFLHELDGWEQAYPLSAFPEPDLKRAAELLKAGGMTLDAVSASNMRHVVSKIAPKAREAISSILAENELLKKTLEPFAKAGADIGAGKGVWIERPYDGYITEHHLLAALAALASIGEGRGG